MKYLMLSIVALLLPRLASANNLVTHLTIEHNNGTTTSIALTEIPVLSFEGSDMLVTSSNFNSRFARDQIINFHFTQQEPAAIESVDAGTYSVMFTANHLSISGSDVSHAEVYDLGGCLLTTATATNGAISIDLSQYRKGVYLVAVKGHPAFKIAVR